MAYYAAMLIRALRLLNIKSFGTGADGLGVRLPFDRGLNRIAGPNGAGKSTVIEALGYACFDFNPAAGSRLDLETLLLRSGTKEGEIEVELETNEGTYFVKRGVGKQSKTRWTVRDSSGFVTHETEPEVLRFLALAAGLLEPNALPDLFRKLVGVRQGRLLDPFESSPTESRKHFAPILDVEIYQRCFNDLLAPVRRLDDEFHAAEKLIARARGEAEVLAGAPEQSAGCRKRLEQDQVALVRLREDLVSAQGVLGVQDALERAIPAAKANLESARRDVASADKAVVRQRELLVRSEKAREARDGFAPGHTAYEKVYADLLDLAQRRKGFDGVRERVTGLKQQRAATEARAAESARRQCELRDEIAKHEAELGERRRGLAERRETFALGAAEVTTPEPSGAQLGELFRALAITEPWAVRLAAAAADAKRAGLEAAQANAALHGFDPESLQRAKAALELARQAFEAKRLVFAETDARRKSRREMAHALEQSRQCPLLAETCRQFDSGKLVLSEVKLDKSIDVLRAESAALEKEFKRAEEAAAAAQLDMNANSVHLHKADAALKELSRHLQLSAHEDARTEYARLATETGSPVGRTHPLPTLSELPHPGLAPWESLNAAPGVAHALHGFAVVVTEAVADWRAVLEAQRDASAEWQRKRKMDQQTSDEEEVRLDALAAAQDDSRKGLEQIKQRAQQALDETSALAKSLEDQEARQGELAEVERLYEQAELLRAQHTEAHQAWLAAQADAGRLDQARAEYVLAVGEYERAKAAAASSLKEIENAMAGYDAAAHVRARAAGQETAVRVGALESSMDHVRQQLVEAERNVRRLEEAHAAWREADGRRALTEARRELLEMARRTLRDAGPRVAEHLIQAVNSRAQKIYTALSPHDPGQLDWRSDYELRVATSNGERRFTMLSGGQRVKAALAVQLALVQQFSQAGLCIFDEPTYALDAESRVLLAESIAAAQAVSKFEQLFVVSHDDAFDGHVEHTVALRYASSTGTHLE